MGEPFQRLAEVARRALLAIVGAPKILLDRQRAASAVQEWTKDEGGQARLAEYIRGDRAIPPPPSAAGCGASRKLRA
jgi:hypothetical protein